MKKLLFGLVVVALIALGVVVVSSYQQAYTLNVDKGWSLVPFGVLSKLSTNDTIQLSDIKYAWVYDLDDKKYVLLMKDGDYTQEAKTKYNFQRGENHWLVFSTVWIYTEKSGRITVYYDGIDSYYYNLKQGWNFKMVTPNMKGQSPRDFVGACNVERYCVWERNNWECGTGEQLLSSSGTMADSDSDLFRGILIKVSNDCSFGSPGGSSVNPPAIPGDSKTNTGFRKEIETYYYQEYSGEECDLNNAKEYTSQADCYSAWKCASEEYAKLIPESDLQDLANYMKEHGGEMGDGYYIEKNPNILPQERAIYAKCFAGKHESYN